MKDQNYRFEQKYCDYYVDKLCETTSKTQNDFYAECAEEIVRLRRNLDKREAQLKDANATISDLEDRLTAWNNYKTEIDEAILANGSYKP